MSDALGFLPDTKPDVAEPWRDVLLDTADRIDKHGWVSLGRRGDWLRGIYTLLFQREAHCVLVTMSCHRIRREMHEAWDRFEVYLGGSMTKWNDTPGRAATEVTAALRACARQ